MSCCAGLEMRKVCFCGEKTGGEGERMRAASLMDLEELMRKLALANFFE